MAQIRWDNINTPNFGAANSLLDSGQDRVTEGLNQLQGLAQEQTNINNENWDTTADQNTADLVNQLNKADTRDALNSVDLQVFGKQVNGDTLNQAFNQRKDQLNDMSNKDRTYQLSADKFANDQAEFKQTQKLQEDKLAWQKDVDTSRLAIEQAKLKNKGVDKNAAYKAFNLKVDNTAQDALTLFPGEPQKYLNYMNNLMSGSNQMTSEEIAAKTAQYKQSYTDYYAMTQDQQSVVNEQQTVNKSTLEGVNSKLDQYDSQVSEIVGVPVDTFNYADDTSVNVADVKESWKTSNVSGMWAGEMDAEAGYQEVTRVLGKPPTGKELEHIFSEASKNGQGRWTQAGAMTDAAESYKTKVLESPYRDKINQHNMVRNSVKFKAEDQLAKNLQTTTKGLNKTRVSGGAYDGGILTNSVEDLTYDMNDKASKLIAELSAKKLTEVNKKPYPSVTSSTPIIQGYNF